MGDFFHCDTQKYITRRKYILWLTLLPLVQGSVIALLITIVNLRAFYEKEYLMIVVYAVGGAAAFGTLFFYTVFLFTERIVKKQARYTFIELSPKALIFSRYAGDYLSGRKIETTRKLYIVPLADLKSIGLCEKSGTIYLEAEEEGKIREYSDRSERLNYKISEGFPEFDSWWYNENGFGTLLVLKISPIFGNKDDSRKLCEKIAETKCIFDNAPKPVPYVHKEPDFIRRKKALDKLKRLAGM